MFPRFPAVRLPMAGSILLFLSVLLVQGALAQGPEVEDPGERFLGFVVNSDDGFIEVPFNTVVYTKIRVTDVSSDALAAILPQGVNWNTHMVTFDTPVILPEGADRGWRVAIQDNPIFLYGGQSREVGLAIEATPLVNVQEIEIHLNATFRDSASGTVKNANLTLGASVTRFDNFAVSMMTPPLKLGQHERATYQVAVTNHGVYPETYAITAEPSLPEIRVASPERLYVPPGETRILNVTIQTPHGKLVELGQSALIIIKVRSESGGSTMSSMGILKIQGPYLPVYWIPLLLMGLLSAGIVTHRWRESRALRRLERNHPRRIRPTPRQAVLLAELKRKSPEGYKARTGSLAAVYRERVKEYRAQQADRARAERTEAREAKREFKLAAKARKRDRKAQRKADKIAAKTRKAEARVENKLRKKKEKELAKRRKVLGKERARLEKRQAKLDARQAKADAKREAKEAKERAKAERAAAREARRARR